ncbi:TetR/AcrR family transcriptional regulator [Nonomuraea sp. NPDC050783]|uniref:TetR/AcrR family transcriptional regulator n=1 Tax=Nonomuraea sp. NPDC050783 TaxID=3154634 RepID=UPI0034666C1F
MRDDSLRRVLDAAYEGMLEQGLRRLTMDDVARRAGLSRVTVYRRFARKGELIEAVLQRELRRFLRAFEQELAPLPTTAERVVEGFALTLRLVRAHPLLTRLLATEPETILPQLTVEAGPYVAVARRYLAERLAGPAGGGAGSAEAEALAETYVRVALSFVLTPDSAIPLRDAADARAYARRHLVPLLSTERDQLDL